VYTYIYRMGVLTCIIIVLYFFKKNCCTGSPSDAGGGGGPWSRGPPACPCRPERSLVRSGTPVIPRGSMNRVIGFDPDPADAPVPPRSRLVFVVHSSLPAKPPSPIPSPIPTLLSTPPPRRGDPPDSGPALGATPSSHSRPNPNASLRAPLSGGCRRRPLPVAGPSTVCPPMFECAQVRLHSAVERSLQFEVGSQRRYFFFQISGGGLSI
jgi:hypothetical protein